MSLKSIKDIKPTKGEEKSKASKAADLERFRQSLAKRSLDVKFDLQDTDYKPIENIGIGAYGVVCSAIHTKSGDRVAIKKIPSVFEALTIAKRTYREIKILKHFKHDNIICIREILLPKENAKDFKDIYVVFDLMESDLHRIIYSEQELSEEHIRYFLYQILRGLKYIHSANVIHRDLKPSNILVNEDCHLRIGDFGMARGIFYTPNEASYYMTQYVATRWYRAPEILLAMLEYGTAVDMWSVGCIFAEMIGRKHLFPGKDYISQLKLIIGVLGTPSEAVLKNCQNDILKRIIKGFARKEPMSWQKLFPKTSKKSLDLLSKMLVINPAERITVEKALSHGLLNNYHDPDDEPICVPPFNFDFEKQNLDKTELRTSIMEEIMSFHQPKPSPLSFSAFLRPAPKVEERKKNEKTEDLFSKNCAIVSLPEADLGKTESSVFKMSGNAEPKPASKVSPVSVDLGKLQVVASSSDVEMLSAQSNDGRPMDTHQASSLTLHKEEAIPEEKDKALGEKDKPGLEKKTGSTISEDTKARVKMALMNPTYRKQRAESQGEEPKDTKPVTAAQRQKEREEKRRKKKERALEKVKKSKDKKGCQEQPILLSTEDMELLRRWTVMQNPSHTDTASPPHPGPSLTPPQNPTTISSTSFSSSCSVQETSSDTSSSLEKASVPALAQTSVGTLSSSTLVNPTVFMSGTQLNLVQANFIPVLAIPSMSNPGKMEIKRIFHSSDLGSKPYSSTNLASRNQTSDSTKSLLQSTILMRSTPTAPPDLSQPKARSVDNSFINLKAQADINFSSNSSDLKEDHMTPNILTSSKFDSSVLCDRNLLTTQEELKEDKLSPRSQGNDLLDFLDQHLKDSPKQELLHNSPYHSSVPDQQGSFPLHRSHENSHINTSTPPAYNTYSQVQNDEQITRSNSTPSLLRHNSHTPSHTSQPQERTQRSSLPFASYSHQTFSNSFPNQSSFQMAYAGKLNETFPHHIDTTAQFGDSYSPHENSPAFSQPANLLNYSPSLPHSNLMFQISPDFSCQPNPQHIFRATDTFGGYPSYTDTAPVTQLSQFHSFNPQQAGIEGNQAFNPQQAGIEGNIYQASSSYTRASESLRQQTKPSHSVSSGTDQSFNSSLLHGSQNLRQPSGAGTSGNTEQTKLRINCSHPARGTENPADLIALLSSKLSRSQVADIFPPALTLTPKGTGAGYGVGMDLDHMLTDAQEMACIRPDQSPLSSSLLADWLDISGNISQADLEALERDFILQSPMHVSYSDINL